MNTTEQMYICSSKKQKPNQLPILSEEHNSDQTGQIEMLK